ARGGLVEDEHARASHEGAADGQHLLLPARHGTRGLASPLGEAREEPEDLLEAFAAPGLGRADVGTHLEILEHGETREDLAALGHLHDAVLHDGPAGALVRAP